MKERLTIIAAMVMFLVSTASLTGCSSTSSHDMMDDSKMAPTGTMDKDSMHDSMGTMEKEGMQEPMSESMEAVDKDKMDKDGMKSDTSGTMK